MKKMKQIKLLGGIGIALLVLIGIATVGMPFLNQANSLNQTKAEIVASNAKLDENIKLLNIDKANVSKVTALYQDLNKKFPETTQPTALLADVSTAASLAGMGANNVEGVTMAKPEPVTAAAATTATGTSGTKTAPTTNATAAPATATGSTAGGSLAEMKVTITVNGSGTQLSAFLGALNKVNRVIKVTGIAITANKDGNSTMTVDGTTYLYKAIAVPAAGVASSSNAPSVAETTAPTPAG